MYIWIGLLAFWLEDVSPVYWVWQKLLFMLGGLMLPLELYPHVVQRAALFTPFPAMLALPASFMLNGGRVDPTELAGILVMWSLVIGFGVRWSFRRATAVFR